MLSSSRKETEAVKIVASTLEADDDSEIVSTSPSNGGRPPIDAAHVPKKLWRHSSMDVCANLETKNESKVLVLYTGGTIGMMRNENGALVPMANALERMIRKAIHLHDEKYATARFGAGNTHKAPLALPSLGPDAKRILYTIYEYEPLLDSSNMTMDDWINIAKDLRRSYELFDGFVILHGTDTLSYTASALSFMLENLGKTVIVTGSQIPIFEIRSDGRDNFLGALIVAGTYCIPEVCVFFNHKLYRGNRTVKRSNGSLDAFDSPNLPSLAHFGIDVHVEYRSVFRPVTIDRFRVHSILNRNVCLLRLFPSITIQTVRALLHPPIEGIVMQTYGSGNVPSNRLDLIDELRRATKNGVLIINTTQCCHGAVQAIYETGAALLEAGVIPGADMTPEAALTKLSYVLSKDEWDLETKRQMMMTNLRGELTLPHTKLDKEMELVEALARSLHLSSSEEMEQLKDVLFPSLICSAVKTGDLYKLESLERYGANLSAGDVDGRTPLHAAASEGRLAVVEFLLGRGASVHSRDRSGNTPLMSAVTGDHNDVIAVLVQCGAHLTSGPHTIGEMLCSAAARGNVKRLISLMEAGADLNQPDVSNRTALHLAAHHNQESCVIFLLKNRALRDKKDDFGLTPADVARKFEHGNILKMLSVSEENYV
ncbi:L-asparaginase-like isoform X1 [Daphnia magna]|uniref:asparaginase n=2 Tax=Daphnia magna TaxID=35525 RepID=A0ABQ9YWU3_9CRUS|nr:L-asparaginase-like isoform X1 [Daphnia magna]XP_032796599.2 L-asparaginase-like isoform X1 [Daphnia magna]XP_045036628.1 L-asparaginase-like isoform X1 [Daphnia magna]KAK4005066.1 hypothetical protein OUZ56_006790 [Daphnia magna]